ncbi:hypothetical protein CERZMDRAFT_111040 [Cercospora zeae-maydis SCOH1-5]|uniref:Cytochrome P450 monooxygenase n=1 Tax=Cercospora zeae-maydis SCOH1-5 TaxID=717836 RepID=A0A6A6FKW8_9PEZI|nr:hypothetical protein CERZMDRAFT_111040 [Cercospora zeae-maydis SCOH1-5]
MATMIESTLVIARRLVTAENILLLLACAATILIILLETAKTPLNRVPGPWLARVTNIPLKLSVITGRRIHYIDGLHKQYGPIVRISPNEVAVNDVASVKKIHAIGSGFEKTQWYGDATAFPRSTVFTMKDRKEHAQRRKLFARGFSKTNIKQHWEGVMREKIRLAVAKIAQEGKFGKPVDILKWWTLMSSDISSHLLFGESFHTLENGEINEYIRVLTNALKGNGIGAELPLVRTIGKRLPFQTTRELWRTNELLADHAKVAVRNMKASQQNKNIFAHISQEAEKGEALTDEDVEWETIALFVAGTDTTAVSLTFLVWSVLRDPILRQAIEREVAELDAEFDDADVESNCPLLNATIEESLRLYGAAPGALPRTVPAGGIDLGGFFLPQNSIVSTHAYSMHRNPEIFDKPLEFVPQRWLAESKDRVSDAGRAAMLPFGAGSRTCLGIHIAYMDLRLAAAEFFRECAGSRLAPSTTEKSMELENFFLIAPKAHRCEILVRAEA